MKKNKRKICIVTGTRAEYGILKSTIKAVSNAEDLELQIVATGAHLSEEFGSTIKEIEKDGFKINDVVLMTAKEDSAEAMAKSVGVGIIGMVKVFKKNKPDVVLIVGDRVEALAAAIAASCMKIVLAHIHGGDSAFAGFDEYARHAITKLSNIHFPVTKKSAERIIKMGEESERVFIVGAPSLDNILKEDFTYPSEIVKKYNLNLSNPIILAVQHPVTLDSENSAKHIKETLEALKDLGEQVILVYPNADAGGRAIIKIIKKYVKIPFIKIYKNIPYEDYLGLMKISSALVGNSSSGIIEASSFHLPVVNIGLRQQGRERADNVIDVDYKKDEIKKALKIAIYDKNFKEKIKQVKNPYYLDGKAGKKIVEVLRTIGINQKLFQKRLTY